MKHLLILFAATLAAQDVTVTGRLNAEGASTTRPMKVFSYTPTTCSTSEAGEFATVSGSATILKCVSGSWAAISGSSTSKFRIQWNGVSQNTVGGMGVDLPSTGGAAFDSATGSNRNLGFISYVDGSTTAAIANFYLPSTLPASLNLIVKYTPSTGTSQQFAIDSAAVCVADGESWDTALGSATQQNITTNASAANNIASVTISLSLTGCAAGERMSVRLRRVGADAGDTSTAVLRVHYLEVVEP